MDTNVGEFFGACEAKAGAKESSCVKAQEACKLRHVVDSSMVRDAAGSVVKTWCQDGESKAV